MRRKWDPGEGKHTGLASEHSPSALHLNNNASVFEMQTHTAATTRAQDSFLHSCTCAQMTAAGAQTAKAEGDSLAEPGQSGLTPAVL
jgi:hypothetical protein